jgi:hypothetical protein
MANNTGKSHYTEVPIIKKYHLQKLPREHKATFYNNKQDMTECLRATRHPSISVGQRYNKPPTLQTTGTQMRFHANGERRYQNKSDNNKLRQGTETGQATCILYNFKPLII